VFLSSVALAGLPAASEKGREIPSERIRFSDPTTEFEVERLTSPSYPSSLPAYYENAVSRRGNFLLYASSRGGSWQAYRLDLRSGASRQLTEARDLDPATLTLLEDDRSFCCFDGSVLLQLPLPNLRPRELYQVPEEWHHGSGFTVAGDGLYAFVIETRGGETRLKRIGMAKGDAFTLIESDGPLSDPLPRPKRAGILYRRGPDALWLVDYDGRNDRRLRTAPGRMGPMAWTADGVSVLYLRFPDEPHALNEIRELTPDTNADRLVAPTSQFVHFGRNGDGSVFVGASGSKAQPHILILLRVTRRELTLCEHGASDPTLVSPIFSPDSQRIFFQSDRDGQRAIYCVPVDRLVEKTES
jgi:oligogalacturonide lyase